MVSHDPEKWDGFKKKYKKELSGKQELIQKIKQIEKEKKFVKLLYTARDKEHNDAVVLEDFLKK